MKPSLPVVLVSTAFVGTIAVLGVAIERQRAPLSPDLLSGPPVAVKTAAATLCVGRQFFDPHELRAAVEGGSAGRVDLVAFSADLAGFTPARFNDAAAVQGRYQSAPEWIRVTLWSQDPPQAGLDIEPACGQARCTMRTRLEQGGVRLEYSFPRALRPEWQRLHTNALARVNGWAKDQSCVRGRSPN